MGEIMRVAHQIAAECDRFGRKPAFGGRIMRLMHKRA